MELDEDTTAISMFLDLVVVDRSGQRLGRVYEVRARADHGAPVVAELLVGSRALLRRMRGPSIAATAIPWSRVIQIDETRIVVSD